VRKGNDTTPSACSLPFEEAKCWLLPPLSSAYSRRQLFAKAAIAASRVGS